MNDVWQTLRIALCDGHRRLSHGLRQMIEAVENDDFETAAALAESLDRNAGSHVEFQERYVFPVVEREAGEGFATQLYDELAELIETLLELQHWDAMLRPCRQTRQRWLDGLEKGLAHVSMTYRFLNHLRTASPDQKARLLSRHQRLRQRAHRWSQLHPRDDGRGRTGTAGGAE